MDGTPPSASPAAPEVPAGGPTQPVALGDIDHTAARRLVEEAGSLLLQVRRLLEAGVSPEVVRQEGDRRSNDLLVERLRRMFPGDGILSEEAPDDLTRSSHRDRLWIIDPLDGTREFGEAERVDWAVHVALVQHGELAVGAVALPAQGITYATDAPPLRSSVTASRPRIAVSRTRPAAEAQTVAKVLGGDLVAMGSAGVKAMAVVSGQIDVYVHSGGQYVWDSAAPVAVAAAAGLHTSRVDGSKLRYDTDSAWLPDLVICRPELASAVLGALE